MPLPLDITLPQGTIGVAVSGGVDSMVLLTALHQQCPASIVALTVEHGIRGEASIEDMQLVVDYCATLGVPCLTHRIDVPTYAAQHRLGTEQAARELRYQWFDALLHDGTITVVATAHHMDDQAETVLLNILRGTGIKGLVGIHPRKGYIRPLLDCTRQQIVDYAAQHHVPYREDSTNGQTDYNRNWLRHVLLPQVSDRYPQYAQSLAKVSKAADEQMQLLDAMHTEPIDEGDWIKLPLSATDAPIALAKYNIQQAMRHYDHGVDFEATHLEAVLRLAQGDNGKCLDLAHHVHAAKCGEYLYMWRDIDTTPVPLTIGRMQWGGHTYVVRPYTPGDRIRFDWDSIPQGAILRAPMPGDRIHKFGGGTKSLGDYYTDNKLPTPARRLCPVVAVGNTIYLSILDIAADCQVTAHTTKVMTIQKED